MPSDNCDVTDITGVYNVEIASHQTIVEKSLYPSDYSCSIRLSAPQSHVINVSFTEFDLQAPVDGECVDYVQFFIGRGFEIPLTEKLCGLVVPHDIISNSSDVTMRFSTDGRIEKSGFRFNFGRVKMTHAKTLGIIEHLEKRMGYYQRNMPSVATNGAYQNSLGKFYLQFLENTGIE